MSSSELKKILVVDDEEKIVEVVKSYLENNGYRVFEAYTGRQALDIFQKTQPALIILDLMLPDMSGEEVCKQLRKTSRAPIIMLTAKVEEDDVITGFALGADDYVTKPFSPRQLIARVEALLRRSTDATVPLSTILSYNNDDLVVDSVKREVRKKNRVTSLTPNEYKILMAMVKYPQKAFTREELVLFALGDDYDGFDRTIDTHIKNLRQKIETDPKNPEYILTIHGVGYRFGSDVTL